VIHSLSTPSGESNAKQLAAIDDGLARTEARLKLPASLEDLNRLHDLLFALRRQRRRVASRVER